MSLLTVLLGSFVLVYLIEHSTKLVAHWQKIRVENLKIKNMKVTPVLDVLKVVTKHECFKMFASKPNDFAEWVGNYLRLKGYSEILVAPAAEDGTKDVTAKNRAGELVYVECKMWDPDTWDSPVDRSIVQKLVGAMVGDSVNNGLIITTATLSGNARQYISQVNNKGLHLEFVEGDQLVRELYHIRENKLKPLLEGLQAM